MYHSFYKMIKQYNWFNIDYKKVSWASKQHITTKDIVALRTGVIILNCSNISGFAIDLFLIKKNAGLVSIGNLFLKHV